MSTIARKKRCAYFVPAMMVAVVGALSLTSCSEKRAAEDDPAPVPATEPEVVGGAERHGMVDLDTEFDAACAALDESTFESLSERHRILVTIWGLEADVNNGGFDQYYFNGTGDQAFYASAALEKIGATRLAAIVREANSHFGPSGPPSDREARSSKLQEVTKGREDLFDDLERRFYEYPDDISALLVAYLEAA